MNDRTRDILEDLEAVRENLLALSDDIWAGVDLQDLTAFDDGVRFMRSFIEKRTAFDQLAAELSVLIQQYTQVSLEASEETGQEDREQNERIIRDLNREEPHTIDEDFTYRRPHGFILDGKATVGITTWQRLFELVCRQLHQRDSPIRDAVREPRLHQQPGAPYRDPRSDFTAEGPPDRHRSLYRVQPLGQRDP